MLLLRKTNFLCNSITFIREQNGFLGVRTRSLFEYCRFRGPFNILFADSFNRFKSRFSQKKDGKSKLVELSYNEYTDPGASGKGIPILILHGLLGSKNNWGSMARALLRSTSFSKIITVDARNHGDSPHTDEFSYELMVSDLLKFIHDQKIEKASLIGHSMGGRVAMLLTRMYPQLVKNLIVVDISPVGQSPNMSELPKLFNQIKGLNIDPYASLSEARKQATVQLKQQNIDDRLISFLMTNMAESSGSINWRWKFNLDSIIKNFESEICRFPLLGTDFNKPTLFVAGSDSDYIRPEDEADIRVLFPSAKFVYIKGAGHWVHAEKPQEFLSAATQFLNEFSE